jgi:glycosyltransferase involved in cell wall biosynthesis
VYRGKTVSVCLPCRNEGAHLAEVVRELPSSVDEVLIVSNRSDDDTVAIATDLGLTVLEDNRAHRGIGYGYAHMTGIAACQSNIIVAADADGSYPLANLESVLDHLLDADLDFVSCNRYPLQDGTSIPASIRLGVQLLNLEVGILYGKRIKDVLSGMWVMRSETRDHLSLSQGDWNLSPEIKLNAMLDPDIRFGEFSIVQHPRQGRSHQRYFQTGSSHARWILARRLGVARNHHPDPDLTMQHQT